MSRAKTVFLIVLPLGLVFGSLLVGRFEVDPLTVLRILASRVVPIERTWPDLLETVVLHVRLPRIIMAMLVGAGLSISGASFQGMFHNPLVGHSILGVSAAAGFGAALPVLGSLSPSLIQVSALAFGLGGVLLTYSLSRVFKTTPTLILVLSGVVVGSFFSALISVIKYLADPYEKLPAITFWLMGSLGNATSAKVLTILPPMALGIGGLLLACWRMNILSMSDDEARALGVRTEALKGLIIVCCTVVTASAVCVAGIIGWVGLIIPHTGRMLVGPDHRRLLPACLSLGASYVLLIDDLSRTVSMAELPLGILTALIGAPFFAYLIRRTKGGWS